MQHSVQEGELKVEFYVLGYVLVWEEYSVTLSNTACFSVSSCGNTGSVRDDWTSTKNSLELIELSSINKGSLV
jgi:hypothetical protein